MSNNTYDYIIIGAGPSGIMTAYKLNSISPNKTILIIDKGESLTTYKQTNIQQGGLDNSFLWQQADSYGYSMTDTDNKTLSLGKGYGGGTLHFGLQYIDNIINKSDEYYKQWKNGSKDYFAEIDNLLGPYKYDYQESNSTLSDSAYVPLKNKIDNTGDVEFYNNKIYSKKPSAPFQAERIHVAELIENQDNITKLKNTEITRLQINQNNEIEYCTDNQNNQYFANTFCLCLGAIQTPILLLNSGIGPGKNIDLPVGQTMYDHAGLVTLYKKPVSTQNSLFNSTEIERINNLSGIPQGFEFKVFDTTANQNNYENLSSTTYNQVGSKMHAIFRHTKLTDDQLVKAIKGEYPGRNISLGTGVYYVYDMGDYWNGGGHSGGSQFGKLQSRSYNLTNVLTGRHGNAYGRLFPGGSNNSKLVGIYKDSYTAVTEVTEYQNLNFKDTEILQHVQTRNPELNWQTYYSIIPGLADTLILTHAHSAKINNKGVIKLTENNEIEITLNHFEDDNQGYTTNELKEYIKSSFDSNHALLTELGYELLPELQGLLDNNVFYAILDSQYMSIYHYHGSCPEGTVVDSNFKVNQVENLFIGDISVLNKPWGGSTSVPALITGIKVAENMKKGDGNIQDFNLTDGWNVIVQTTYNKAKYTIENYSNGSFYKFNNGAYDYFTGEDGVILNKNEVAWIKVNKDAKIVLTEIT